MRFTSVLCATHIGNAFKNIWKVQKQRKVLDFGVRQQLEARGVAVAEALHLAGLAEPARQSAEPAVEPSSSARQPCRVYSDRNFLLGGLDQALNLTRTAVVSDQALPERVDAVRAALGDHHHRQIREAALVAHLLDAVQEKLPRGINLVKPGWVSPREYGLPKRRRNQQLMTKMFQTCDAALVAGGVDVAAAAASTGPGRVREPLADADGPLWFDVRVGRLVCGRTPLPPYVGAVDVDVRQRLLARPLPSIHPLHPTITIFPGANFPDERFFPVGRGAPLPNAGMAVFHFNMPWPTCNPSQRKARVLVHGFAVAAAVARQRFGEGVVELPEPVVLNCVHTDGQRFQFACLQVESLDLEASPARARNLLWLPPEAALFERCAYVDGQPVLDGYNPHVVETLLALYRSQLEPSV